MQRSRPSGSGPCVSLPRSSKDPALLSTPHLDAPLLHLSLQTYLIRLPSNPFPRRYSALGPSCSSATRPFTLICSPQLVPRSSLLVATRPSIYLTGLSATRPSISLGSSATRSSIFISSSLHDSDLLCSLDIRSPTFLSLSLHGLLAGLTLVFLRRSQCFVL